MVAITSPGLGSGLDVNSIVSQLVAAEAAGPTSRLDRRETTLQVRLSAYGTLKGAVSQFQGSLANLQDLTSYQTKTANSSDTDVLSASVSSSAISANYDIKVSQLAEQHRLSTDPINHANAQFTEVTDVVGTGTLTFKFGTTDYVSGTDTYNSFTPNADKASKSITITDGSIKGIRDAVNEADIGVTASIIFDGTYQRLTFSSDDSGAANSLQIVTSDIDGDDTNDSGLSLLAFNDANGGTSNLAQNVAAQDSILTVNGIQVSSENNTIKDVLDGVTLNLKEVGNTTLDIDIDANASSSAIKAFVANYNGLIGTINNLTSFDVETGQAAQLNGDGVVRSLETQLKRLLGDPVNSSESSFSVLSDVGITSNATTGLLEIDEAKLSTALTDEVNNVIGLFAAFGQSSDSGVIFDSATDSTREGTYAVDVTSFATQGTLTGSAAANLTIVSGTNDTLTIDLDGVTADVVLTAGTYTTSALVAELQSQINATQEFIDVDSEVTVSESAGIFSISSNRYGATSSVTITGGNGSTDLVGSSATGLAGTDIIGNIGGVAATGSGQYLIGAGGALGLKIQVEGGSLGDRGNISFARGFSERFDGYLEELLDNKGLFDSTIGSLKSRIEGITDEREDLARRLVSIEQRTRSQFIALDVLVSQLQSTGNFLTTQLDSLPDIGTAINRR